MIIKVTKRLSPTGRERRYRVTSNGGNVSHDHLDEALRAAKAEAWLAPVDAMLIRLTQAAHDSPFTKSKVSVEITIV